MVMFRYARLVQRLRTKHMKKTKSRFEKNVQLTLPPGDPGPVCSYSPYCSPSDRDRNLALWRQARIHMTEENMEDVTRDDESALINTWILQLVRRELTLDLARAEKKLCRRLEFNVGARAAEIISTALKFRGPEPKA